MGVMMSKLVRTSEKKNWIPIEDFLKKAEITRDQMYKKVYQRIWWNGFVLKKPTTGRSWKFGCLEDYNKWAGI